VGPKGRVVIPVALRHRYGLAEGDELDGPLGDGDDLVDVLVAERRADAQAGRFV
jgi:hypothetical protein